MEKKLPDNEINFGEFLFKKRVSQNLTLRSFCFLTGEDIINWSKIERNLINPPKERNRLDKIAEVLNITKNSNDYINLINLASIQKEEIPKYITKENVMEFLPSFFPNQNGEKPNKEQIQKLIDSLIGQKIN